MKANIARPVISELPAGTKGAPGSRGSFSAGLPVRRYGAVIRRDFAALQIVLPFFFFFAFAKN